MKVSSARVKLTSIAVDYIDYLRSSKRVTLVGQVASVTSLCSYLLTSVCRFSFFKEYEKEGTNCKTGSILQTGTSVKRI